MPGEGEERLFQVLRAGHRSDLVRRALGEQPAVLDEAEALAALRLVHDVARNDDRGAVLGHAAEALPELDAELRVDADGGLIEQEQLRLVHERARQRAALPHASAQG
jgi:hypothetical protein